MKIDHFDTSSKLTNFLDASPNTILNPIQAAEILKLKPGTLAIWRSTGRYPLRYVKLGRRVGYRVADIREFIESRMAHHTGESVL